MRWLRPRPTALIEREQVRLQAEHRQRISDPEAARDRRIAQTRRGEQATAKARTRAAATEAEEASVMHTLRTSGTPLRTLALACLATAQQHNGEVDPNHVRAIVRPGGEWVPALYRRGSQVSGFYASLVGAGLLRKVGTTRITGDSGNNGGRPVSLFELTPKGHRVLSNLPVAPWLTGATATAAERLAAEIDQTRDDTDDLFCDLMGETR